jgi:predicted double-glycine peptidase
MGSAMLLMFAVGIVAEASWPGTMSQGRPVPGWESALVLQSTPYGCGAAALATLLALSGGESVAEADVYAVAAHGRGPQEVERAGGFSLLDLEAYVRKTGMRAVAEGGLTLEDLERRVPVLVPVDAEGGRSHFVVVAGSDDGRLAVVDPGRGAEWMDSSEFERIWHGIGFRLVDM